MMERERQGTGRERASEKEGGGEKEGRRESGERDGGMEQEGGRRRAPVTIDRSRAGPTRPA